MNEEAHGKVIQVRALDGLALPLGMIFQEFCRLTEPPPQPVAVSLSCPLPVSHKPRPFLLVMADTASHKSYANTTVTRPLQYAGKQSI